jgi:hypothetical protein
MSRVGLFTGLNQPFVSTNKLVLFNPKPSDVLSDNVIIEHTSLPACRRVASAPDVTLLFSVMLWRTDSAMAVRHCTVAAANCSGANVLSYFLLALYFHFFPLRFLFFPSFVCSPCSLQ